MICLERFMSFLYSIVLIILCFQLLQFDGLLCFLVSSHCEFTNVWVLDNKRYLRTHQWRKHWLLTVWCIIMWLKTPVTRLQMMLFHVSAALGAPRSAASDRAVCIYRTRSMLLVSRPHWCHDRSAWRAEADVKVAALRGGAAQINLCEWLISSWRPWQLPGSTPASRLCCKKPADGWWCGRDERQRYKHF